MADKNINFVESQMIFRAKLKVHSQNRCPNAVATKDVTGHFQSSATSKHEMRYTMNVDRQNTESNRSTAPPPDAARQRVIY